MSVKDHHAIDILKRFEHEDCQLIEQNYLPVGLLDTFGSVIVTRQTLSDIIGITTKKLKELTEEWEEESCFAHTHRGAPFFITCPSELSFDIFQGYNNFIDQLYKLLENWMNANGFDVLKSDLKWFTLHLWTVESNCDKKTISFALQKTFGEIVYQNSIVL